MLTLVAPNQKKHLKKLKRLNRNLISLKKSLNSESTCCSKILILRILYFIFHISQLSNYVQEKSWIGLIH